MLMNIHKINTAPVAPYEANGMYIYPDPDNAAKVIIAFATEDGAAIKQTLSIDNVDTLIDAKITGFATSFGQVYSVADLDELAPLVTIAESTNKTVWVYVADPRTGSANINGTDVIGDSTVKSGYALYAYNPSVDTWKKIGEGESMDFVFNWDDIIGKPAWIADISVGANDELLYKGAALGNVIFKTQEW